MSDWETIVSAVGRTLSGEREAGKGALTRCWRTTSESDHAQRCVIAHYLADLEPQVDDEVSWDETALAAYAHVEERDLAAIGIADARGLEPSLHLNLGDGYLRQGRVAQARAQVAAGITAQEALENDGYGMFIRNGLADLRARVEAAQAPPHESPP